MKNKKLIMILIISFSLILTVIGYIVLPDTLVMQISTTGAVGNTAPKILGLILPLALSCIFSVMYYKSESNKSLFVSLIGLAIYIFLFVFNIKL